MADQPSETSQDHHLLRDLARWLLLIPIVLLILFGCGQLALYDTASPAAPDTRSKMRADYRTWPIMMLPAIDPAIIEDLQRDERINPLVIVKPFWPTPNRPIPTPQPTLIAAAPTATSQPAASTPTVVVSTSTPQATSPLTPYPTATRWPTWTSTPYPAATDMPQPTATHRPPRPPTNTPPAANTPTASPTLPPGTGTPTATSAPPNPPTDTATPTATSTDTPTATSTPPNPPTDTATPTATSTDTPTDTATPTATSTDMPTPTATVTPTDTATPTITPTSTPTPTATPPLCTGNMPGGEPNIGLPNGTVAVIPCGGYIDIDLGGQRITSHPGGYDFVDYEQYSAACGGICLDWVQIDVCDASCSNWVTVFNWGDGLPDNNTNVASFAAGGEDDNEPIPAAALLNNAGITIDVDAFGPVPPSGYRYIRIWSPINWPNNDGAEVDSVQIVP